MSILLHVGVDEAGRGPLAGPVYAAAVILNPYTPISGLADSKALSQRKREMLAEQIKQHAYAWAIAEASVYEIDNLNILQASLLAMQRAIEKLPMQPEHVFVDGKHCPKIPYPVSAVVQGDKLVPCISAASILAKVARDQVMLELANDYPEYDFAVHKGYPTAQHLAALKRCGVSPVHRRSFKPVRELLMQEI